MSIRVLIVDDSIAYRSKIKSALADVPWIEVVGVASNGKIALEMISQKSVDLLTLDMEMPVMNGLQTLKELRQKDRTTKAIVFSSSTVRGSEATMEALASGADDFVAKPAGDEAFSPEDLIRRDLLPKIEQFRFKSVTEREYPSHAPTRVTPHVVAATYTPKTLDTFNPAAIVIASSTGGPTAHETIFKNMNGKLRCPIFIAQHMPPVFTTSFAKRIASYSGLPCKEAEQGEVVRNQVYVAPGDFHLNLAEKAGQIITVLDKMPSRNSVRPAADFLFESAAKIYGSKLMGFVLTGMGEDGLEGAKAVKQNGGGIMIQDEKSCVVFGMPGAVFNARLQDDIGGLSQIRSRLMRMALV